MRKNLTALIFLVICSVVTAQQPQPAPVTPGEQKSIPAEAPTSPATNLATTQPPPPDTLLDGTPVKLRLSQTISSADTKVGQEIPFEVVEEISVNHVIVLPKGATAIATVTTAEHKKSMGRAGRLDISISYARLKDQEKVALRATQENKGGGHVGAMTGAMVATAIVFFPAAPLFLFIHGKDVVIPQGTEVTAFVQGDMKLDMAKFAPVPPAAAMAAAPAAAASGLTIDASVPNCDIEVDGSFVGNTPSTLNLAPGKHDIVVKKAGYKDWTRSMAVTGGTIRLSAEMVAQ